VQLYTRACDAGGALGCDNLALAYEAGHGVVADPARAASLHRRACELFPTIRPNCAQIQAGGH
jgi:hypothetical protein